MNLLLSKNERNALDEALPEIIAGGTELEFSKLSLSGTHTQSSPFLNAASQFAGKVVQFAVKPVIDYESRNPGISKNVLAAMAGDPDPAKSLADIRSLLVDPTRKIHDAMFDEVVTILEESDREVQNSLRALESRCAKLSHVTNELASSSLESKDQNRVQIEHLQKEIQKSAQAQQGMLSEMFLVIDSKIEELTTQINRKTEDLVHKIETSMREAAASQERAMQELEARCLAISRKSDNFLESRIANLEKTASSDQENVHEVFADGLSIMADRLKALRDQTKPLGDTHRS
jgi:hypothetical protein